MQARTLQLCVKAAGYLAGVGAAAIDRALGTNLVNMGSPTVSLAGGGQLMVTDSNGLTPFQQGVSGFNSTAAAIAQYASDNARQTQAAQADSWMRDLAVATRSNASPATSYQAPQSVINSALLATSSYTAKVGDWTADYVAVQVWDNPSTTLSNIKNAMNGGLTPIPPTVDKGDGFRAVLYQNQTTKEYTLAYAGTNDSGDVKADLMQAAGARTAQYDQAIKVAKQIMRLYPGEYTGFVGHSLGGGLASAASIVQGVSATVFNPAGVHQASLTPYGRTLTAAPALVSVYRVKGEALTTVQDALYPITPKTTGTVVKNLDADNPSDKYWRLALGAAADAVISARKHSMTSVLQGLGYK